MYMYVRRDKFIMIINETKSVFPVHKPFLFPDTWHDTNLDLRFLRKILQREMDVKGYDVPSTQSISLKIYT